MGLAAIGLGVLLPSCSRLKTHYCEAEGRVIPDAEVKARAVVALLTTEGGRVPINMQRLLAEKLPNGGNDAQMVSILEEYITKYPLCCQINYDDRGEYGDAPPDALREINAVGTLYLLEGREDAFMLREEVDAYKDKYGRLPPQYGYNSGFVTLAFGSGINACGDKVRPWSRG